MFKMHNLIVAAIGAAIGYFLLPKLMPSITAALHPSVVSAGNQ